MSLYTTEVDLLDFDSLTNKCLVLDIDETLVHTLEQISWIKDLKIYKDSKAFPLRDRVYKLNLDDVVSERGEGVLSELAGILRPHLKDFILFAFLYFKIVCIWSAGKQKYVHQLVKIMFKDTKEPNLIFTYNDCKQGVDKIEKPLEYMFNIPGINKYMNLKNTFVIDDRKDTFMDVNPGNGIVIPEYRPDFNIKGLIKENNALIQLMIWFCQSEVVESTDVRTIDKTNIFKYDLDVLISFDFMAKLHNLRLSCKSCNKLSNADMMEMLKIYDESNLLKA
jgi:TFIIF-interacting CTD phosphatase-like protein